jgi:hypothetical protein
VSSGRSSICRGSACRGLAAGQAASRRPLPLVISGEQGSAKTVLSKMLRALVDPNVAPARTLPREERDLFIANNGHVLAGDRRSNRCGGLRLAIRPYL